MAWGAEEKGDEEQEEYKRGGLLVPPLPLRPAPHILIIIIILIPLTMHHPKQSDVTRM